MSIWKEPTPARKDPAPMPQDITPRKDEEIATRSSANYNQPPRARAESKETLIAADLCCSSRSC